MNNNKKLSIWKRFMQSMTKKKLIGKDEGVMTNNDYNGLKNLEGSRIWPVM